MATIRCTVKDCEYWEAGNNCSADQILVVAASQESIGADHHGKEAEKLPQVEAGTKASTLCYTFEKE